MTETNKEINISDAPWMSWRLEEENKTVQLGDGWKRATKDALSLTADYVLMTDGLFGMIIQNGPRESSPPSVLHVSLLLY